MSFLVDPVLPARFRRAANPVSKRDWSDAHLVNAIIAIHDDDPEFGYRFIADELKSGGHLVGEGHVHRLCREFGIVSTVHKKGSKAKKPGPAVHDDLVRRNFVTDRPDKVWLTDITEHPTGEGKLYLCAIKDVFSNRIVGYALGSTMTAALATAALRGAIARRQPDKVVIVHSDRGSQFRSRLYRAALLAVGFRGSMGRVGSAADNAAMESFFSLLQKNVFNRGAWTTRDELHNETVYWIEHTYNRRRRQRALGKLTPVEYELAFTTEDEGNHAA